MADSKTSWFTTLESRPRAQVRLFCFPHGGGGPHAFSKWPSLLPSFVEVVAVHYPGRGSRHNELPISDPEKLVSVVVDGLEEYIDRPFAIFGHSVGGLMAFEVARRLARKGRVALRLFVSSHAPPSLEPKVRLSELDDRSLVSAVLEMGLLNPKVLEQKELVEWMAATLRADFALSERYQFTPDMTFGVPIVACCGDQDSSLPLDTMKAWADCTSGTFDLKVFSGGHFYLEPPNQLLGFLGSQLAKDRSTLAPSILKGPDLPYPQQCLHERFRDQARRTPGARALFAQGTEWTFAQLDQESDLLARFLQQQGVGPDSLVGICMHHCAEYVIAMLGILKAGGAYLQLEAEYPSLLLSQALAKTKPVAVLTRKPTIERLQEVWSGTCVEMDSDWKERLIARSLPPLDKDRRPARPDDLAYCVMSSGTTGEPKAIICPHRGAVNSYHFKSIRYPYAEDDRVAVNVFFVWEVLRPLLDGRPAYLIPDDVIFDPARLIDYLERHEITRVLLTPSLLDQVLNYVPADKLKQLRLVWANGEVLPTQLKKKFSQRLPHVRLINLYSIAECHDVCLMDCNELDTATSPRIAPVGSPSANVTVMLLDEALQPVPMGAPGEIYVAGENLGRGYLQDPEKTRTRFIASPFEPGATLYRTGDFGRMLPGANLEIQGRVDFVVKLRGYTVVLGAVETAVTEHPWVDAAAVVTKDHPVTKQPEALIAYVVPAPGVDSEALLAQLRTSLKQKLPHYAVPAHIIPVNELPLSEVTGKLDRRRLPEPVVASGPLPQNTGGLHGTVAAVFSNLLGLAVSSSDDNFFDLGGHSLLAIEACHRLSSALNVELNVIDLFEHPTVGDLEAFLKGRIQPSATIEASSGSTRRRIEPSSDAIAIIGASCRFPGASNIEQFWDNLTGGVCSIRALDDEELRSKGIPEHVLANPDYVKLGALVDSVDRFDFRFWGLSEREARLMDPQQRLFLECCWEALEVAGYPPLHVNERTGVFAGCYFSSYLLHNLGGGGLVQFDNPTEHHLTELGNDKDYLATRVSYMLNLRGPSVSVQTSCSTGLVAAATACQNLQDGTCDLALAGAASITFPQAGYAYEESNISSPDGVVRTFDAQANGTVLGDGVGAVVLKRLDDARRDNDNILAVIRGFGINNDGRAKGGYSSPSVVGQRTVIQEALLSAGVDPRSISYVEAHGTGTRIGDPIEVRALKEALEAKGSHPGCALGSVKTNIGHANIAAGMAGLLKTALCLMHRQLVPTINFTRPNPLLELEESPFHINGATKPWEGPQPLRAGVSCFGIGGTNCHMILEEPPRPQERKDSSGDMDLPHPPLLVLSAKSAEALDRQRDGLLRYLANRPELPLERVVKTLQVGREHFEHRWAVPALQPLDTSSLNSSGVKGKAVEGPRVVLLFPGQGSQYPGMGRGMLKDPVFRSHFEQCSELFERHTGERLEELLEKRAPLAQPLQVQPTLFSVEYSLAQTLLHWGVRPVAVLGHSLGEYAAACTSGTITLEEGVELVVARAQGMEKVAEGRMLAATLTEAEVRKFLIPGVDIAIFNSPSDIVLSGEPSAVQQVEQALQKAGVRCHPVHVNRAFHSPMMQPVAAGLLGVARRINPRAPLIPLASNLTGNWLTADDAQDPSYWPQQMLSPVVFTQCVQRVLELKPAVVVEVGPGRALLPLVSRSENHDAVHAGVPTLPHVRETEDDRIFFLRGLARLWTSGVRLNWGKGNSYRPIALPTYPFEPTVCWRNPSASTHSRPPEDRRQALDQWFYLPSWARSTAPYSPCQESLRFLLLQPTSSRVDPLAERIADALAASGHEVIRAFRDREASYAQLLARLHEEERFPHRLISLCALTDQEVATDSRLELFYDLLGLVRAVSAVSHSVETWVLTNKTLQVDQEEVAPLKAALIGPVLVLGQEDPSSTCRLLDVQVGNDPVVLADRLHREFVAHAPDASALVAWRGNRRWTPRFEAMTLRPDLATKGQERLRGGVHVITGGLGRIGLTLAQAFAALDCRVVLATRSSTEGMRDDERLRTVDGLRAAGAAIEVIQADVSRLEDVERLFSETLQRYGRIDGVFHAAGVARLTDLSELTNDIGAAEFSPKVTGLLHLTDAISRLSAPPKLLVLFSSLAAVLGGYGMAAYAGANRVLDSFTQQCLTQTPETVCINWDDWQFSYTQEQTAAYDRTTARYAIKPEEGVECLLRVLGCSEPVQLMVSTRPLEPRLERWLQQRVSDPHPATPGKGVRHDELLGRVATIYGEILGLTTVDPEADFFDSGGDSLLAGQILVRLRRIVNDGSRIGVGTIFDHPSVQEITEWLKAEGLASGGDENQANGECGFEPVGLPNRVPGQPHCDALEHRTEQDGLSGAPTLRDGQSGGPTELSRPHNRADLP